MVLQNLAEVMDPFGRVVALEADSSNLINVIEAAFNVSNSVFMCISCVSLASCPFYGDSSVCDCIGECTALWASGYIM